jgi:hypothetical protein
VFNNVAIDTAMLWIPSMLLPVWVANPNFLCVSIHLFGRLVHRILAITLIGYVNVDIRVRENLSVLYTPSQS